MRCRLDHPTNLVVEGLQAKMEQEKCKAHDLPCPELHFAVRVNDKDHTGEHELAQQVNAFVVPCNVVTIASRQHINKPSSHSFVGALSKLVVCQLECQERYACKARTRMSNASWTQ